MNLTYFQSTGFLINDNGVTVAKGWAGNDSRPDTNPDHIHGYNNPDAQNLHNIGPLPQGVYNVGAWGHYPKVGDNAAPLTQIEGESFGRSGFFIHGPGADPANSSEGCIVIPHNERLAVMALRPDTITVNA